MTLRPTAILVTAFLAGAALAEIGVRATGAFQHDPSTAEASRLERVRTRPLHPVRSVEPAPRRARVAI